LSARINVETDISPSVRATAYVESRFAHKANSEIVIFFVSLHPPRWKDDESMETNL